MPIAIISHPDCGLHDMGSGHPEQPARLSAIFDRLIASGLEMIVRQIDAPLATREQLERVHEPHYVQSVFDQAPTEGVIMLDPDTAMGPHTLAAALRAAGAVVHAVDLVMNREFQAVFCAVRPPGHHAERNRAMGFCLFNNIAVGVAHAIAAHGVSRVAIVDFDVHHGNGTEDIFAGDSRVLMVSTFQHPLYPYSGTENQAANMVNVPLAEGSGSDEFRDAVRMRWLPALERHRPEIIYVSAGFDAHREDPLAGLKLVESDYAWVTRELLAVAARHAKGRIVSALEGGYALSALGRSATEHIREMIAA